MPRKTIFTYQLCIAVLLTAQLAVAQGYEVATDYWPPFREASDNGDIKGYDVDLMTDLGRRMDVDFTFARYPWSRCLGNMEQGRSDLMTGLAKTPEREEYILYSNVPYHQCNPAFYSRKGHGIHVATYADLRGLSIGYTRGSAYFEPFDSDTGLNKVPVVDEQTLVRMLLRGRLDAIVGTNCQVLTDIRRMGLQDRIEQVAFEPDVAVELYIGVSRKSPLAADMDKLNRALEGAIKDGVIDTLDRKYFP